MKIVTGFAKNPPLSRKNLDQFYCTRLSMDTVSTVQYKLVCFSGGEFADPVMSRLKYSTYRVQHLGGHDLELLPLLARRLLGLVVWYRHLLATFGGFFPVPYIL